MFIDDNEKDTTQDVAQPTGIPKVVDDAGPRQMRRLVKSVTEGKSAQADSSGSETKKVMTKAKRIIRVMKPVGAGDKGEKAVEVFFTCI